MSNGDQNARVQYNPVARSIIIIITIIIMASIAMETIGSICWSTGLKFLQVLVCMTDISGDKSKMDFLPLCVFNIIQHCNTISHFSAFEDASWT